MIDDEAGFPSEIRTEAVENIDNFIAQEALWETGRGPSFSANDSLVIAATL